MMLAYTRECIRLALAMGEVVQRAGCFFNTGALIAVRLALAMGEVVQRAGSAFFMRGLSRLLNSTVLTNAKMPLGR